MSEEKKQFAELKIGDKSIDLPIVIGTENEKAVDISGLRKTTGYVTLDPSFMNTASCYSSITFVDGEKGILRYRGIPIEDKELQHCKAFTEVSFNRNFYNLT